MFCSFFSSDGGVTAKLNIKGENERERTKQTEGERERHRASSSANRVTKRGRRWQTANSITSTWVRALPMRHVSQSVVVRWYKHKNKPNWSMNAFPHEEKDSRLLSKNKRVFHWKSYIRKNPLYMIIPLQTNRIFSLVHQKNTSRQRTRGSGENRTNAFVASRSVLWSTRTIRRERERVVGERSLYSNDNPELIFWQVWSWVHTHTHTDTGGYSMSMTFNLPIVCPLVGLDLRFHRRGMQDMVARILGYWSLL